MSLGRHIDICLHEEASTNSDKFERIGEVQELGGIELTSETIEDTPYGSDQGDYRGYDYGLKDGGEVTVTVRYNSTNTRAQALADAFHNSTKEKIALKFPAAIGKQFEATVLVTKVGIATEKAGKIERQFIIKITGAPTFATLVPFA